MPVEVPKPSQSSFIFLDTSALIDYLIGGLRIPNFDGVLETNFKEFINKFRERGLGHIRITPSVKLQAKNWRNIISRLAYRQGVPPYLFARLESAVKARYTKLLGFLKEENAQASRYDDVVAFYNKHSKKPSLVECRKKKLAMSPLPEGSDMRIVAELCNYPGCYFIAADCDYYSVTDELKKDFQIFVLSQDNMYPVMREWGWS